MRAMIVRHAYLAVNNVVPRVAIFIKPFQKINSILQTICVNIATNIIS